MSHHQIVIASRDGAESAAIRKAIGQPSILSYHKIAALLDYLVGAPDSFLVLTSLILDETAIGLLNKCAIIAPIYSVMYARHCDHALNLLSLYGAGCAHILGPDELDLLSPLLSPSEDMLASFTIPPFFVDDDDTGLREPPSASAQPVHISFLGSQALMSCANALQHIPTSSAMSMSVIKPQNPWAQEHLVQSITTHTCWSVYEKPAISGGCITLCNNFNALVSLEPTSKHFVICHGDLSEAENEYVERLPEDVRVVTATDDGYMMRLNANQLESGILPRKLWRILVSALFDD